ncbi:MAG: DUF4855 domain-containing protein [Muribaculaceae bacterium]
MKVITTLFTVVLITLASFNTTEAQEKSYKTNQIRDLALIYQGGAQRIDWNIDQFTPYVTHQFADGSKNWLFDGFLFLEFADGRGYNFSPGYAKNQARKTEWIWLLNRLFEKEKSLDALDKCIDAQKKIIGKPNFKHKVVLGLTVPIPKQKDWGAIDGDSLDFNLPADQLKATKWYIDQLMARFKNAKYKNLELTGFYWVDEDMAVSGDVTKSISLYIDSLKKEFTWIPYWKARGSDNWKNAGFDIAYQQPNHFFSKDIPDSRLDDACKFALSNGMAMEFECDSNALFDYKDSSYDRMLAYINAFEKYGVFKTSAIAYYTGSTGFIDMFKSKSKEDHEIMDRLARLIVERRNIKSLVK